MKTLILDGSQSNDPLSEAIRSRLENDLSARGGEVETVRIAAANIGPCMGDFFCWVRTPGMCALDDDNRTIAQSFVHADLVVYLTPVTFGGYSYDLKRAIDHLIQAISPFFTTVNGEIHHQKRYDRYPRLLAIGWLPGPDPANEAIFHHLVHRNGINMHAANVISGMVYAGQPADETSRKVNGWVESVMGAPRKVRIELPDNPSADVADIDPPERALLLVGSPRGKTSSSQMLGGFLLEQLAGRGIETETIRLYTTLKSEARQQELLQAVAKADLVMLAAPLYVDSLPAPVIRILERIAADRSSRKDSRRQRFGLIVNCGFPESAHNRTAAAICESFAHQAGFEWAGALLLGGGEGIVHGQPLEEAGGRTWSIRQSLTLAAEALAAGKVMPPEALALMAKPVIPPWLYRLFGGSGWKQQAKEYNQHRNLHARPYKST